jgi:hypothetical protein
MGEVYNSTTVEFGRYSAQSPTQRLLSSRITKYGLPILGGLSLGIGAVVLLTSFLAPDTPSWLLFSLGLLLLTLGLLIILVWRFWGIQGRGFTVLKPRVKESSSSGSRRGPEADDGGGREEEFVNQDGSVPAP